MPELARQYDRSKYRYNYYNTPEQKSYYHQNFTREQPNVRAVPTQQRYVRRTVDTKKVERNNFIHRIFLFLVVNPLWEFVFFLRALIR